MPEFTPAAERALAIAGRWTSTSQSELALPEILIGLLAEPECRAALLLAEHNIDQQSVINRWQQLSESAENEESQLSRSFSPQLAAAVREAEARLFEYPRPLQLATEHLLLGLALAPSEVSLWLSERGFNADALEARVHQFAGHQPGLLAWDDRDEAEAELTEPSNDQALTEDPDSDAAVMAREPLPMPDVEEFTVERLRATPEESPDVLAREETAVLRIIDAAANRASEALRVAEDYVRFVLDDRHLTEQLKLLRHELTQTLAAFPTESRHAARDTLGDVGTQVTCNTELARGDIAEVVTAAFKRLEQSLRSLEEYSKVLNAQAASACEQLRYRTYTMERAVDVTRTSLQRFADVRLYVLVDGRESVAEFARLMKLLVDVGVGAIQLRDKKLNDRELLSRARTAREITAGTRTLYIMNDRSDLAALSAADGVHLGQEELQVREARTIVGPRALIGISCHSIEQARKAVLDGANYIGVGPTFPSATKEFHSFPGLELLRIVSQEIQLPAFAIGGICADNLSQILTTGFHRIAVSSAITSAESPAQAASQLLRQLSEYIPLR